MQRSIFRELYLRYSSGIEVLVCSLQLRAEFLNLLRNQKTEVPIPPKKPL